MMDGSKQASLIEDFFIAGMSIRDIGRRHGGNHTVLVSKIKNILFNYSVDTGNACFNPHERRKGRVKALSVIHWLADRHCWSANSGDVYTEADAYNCTKELDIALVYRLLKTTDIPLGIKKP